MNQVSNQTHDEERAFYGSRGLAVDNCQFDGPADGESAFKECADLRITNCFFNLRYPFWHDTGLRITDSVMTELCRAALWYSRTIAITDTRLHGIKALRECRDIAIKSCDIRSPEFGWFTHAVSMENCTMTGEYVFMRSADLAFRQVTLNGKYSFQYVENASFENCRFDTKDAFWHTKNVTVKNSVLKGEYLAWYSDSLTLINCQIIGTQPLCYCKNLKLIDCEMMDTDLSFEKSEVEATLTAPILSIKNPHAGTIRVPAVGEIIRDDPNAAGEILIGE